MITAVVDTNVLASGFVRAHPEAVRVLDAWRARRFALIVSDHILGEPVGW